MQVRTDLREYTADAAPEDWSALWDPDVVAAIRRGAVETADRARLECSVSTGLAGLQFDAAGAVEDVEVLALLSLGDDADSQTMLLGLRVGGTKGAEDGLLVYADATASQVEIGAFLYEAGAAANVYGPLNLAVPSRHPVWLRVRLTGVPGSGLLSTRLWALGDPEPAAWDDEDVPVDGGFGEPVVPASGAVAFLATPTAAAHALHVLTIGTDGDPAPDPPKAIRDALEDARPTYLVEAVVQDAAGDEVTRWYAEIGTGQTTAPTDYPAGETLDPVLARDFAVDLALDYDELQAVVPEQVRAIFLEDPPIGEGATDEPAPRPVRDDALALTWAGGRVTLYALPGEATSLRERVALVTGTPATEPEIGDGRIEISLDSPLAIAAERDVAVNRHVGCPSGWKRVSGNQRVDVAHAVAYDLTSFTYLVRFRSSAFPTATGQSRMFLLRRADATALFVWSTLTCLGDGSGKIQWTIGDGATVVSLHTTSARYDDDLPHALAISIDGARRFWIGIDGELLAEGVPSFAPSTPAVTFWIARNVDNGWISDVRLLGGYLDPEAAFALQETAPRTDDLDLAYISVWAFDDGAGNTVTDYGPAGQDGTASGTETTNFLWVPTDLGMPEQAGRPMPWGHGTIAHAAAERIDPQRFRYRIHDREIVLPAVPAVEVLSRGVGVSSADAGGGVRTTLVELDEPTTWRQTAELLYADLLAELLEVRCGFVPGSTLDSGSLAMLAALLPDAAGWAAAEDVQTGELLARVLGDPGGHLRENVDGRLVAGYLLPPCSPGPDGTSAVLEHVGIPGGVHVPPPSSSTVQNYTWTCWVRCFNAFGTPEDRADYAADDLMLSSTFISHYRPGSADLLFALGVDGRNRSSVAFGDSVSSAPFFVSAPGLLPVGEWVFLAAVVDGAGGTRKLYRMLQGGSAVELVASGAYAGVTAGERPGDGYTVLGARPDGSAPLVGAVAEIGFWGVALSAGSLDLVAAGTPMSVSSGIISYIPATEGDGPFVRDQVAGRVGIVGSQRWAPREVLDLWAMRNAVRVGTERRLRPARSIRVGYRPNFRQLTDGDVAGAVSSAAERRSLFEAQREVPWYGGPAQGVDLAVRTPLYRALSAHRVLELLRLRRATDRWLREVSLAGLGASLRPTEEVRLDNLVIPGGGVGSWTGRIATLGHRPDAVELGLWG